MRDKDRVLAMAVATGRIGYVFCVNGTLRDWRLSRKAARDAPAARAFAETWIANLRPNVVVTEYLPNETRKSNRTRELIHTIAAVAVQKELHSVEVFRTSEYANKYEEAAALVKRFPELTLWVPKKPKIWQNEPINTVYFEALALALPIIAPE